MQINPVTSFKGVEPSVATSNEANITEEQVNLPDAQPDKFEKKTGGGGKAVASAFIPGLGQFIDGRGKDGAKYLLAFFGIGAASAGLSKSIVKDVLEAGEDSVKSGSRTAKLVGVAVLGVAGLATYIKNIVDAYKGEKK